MSTSSPGNAAARTYPHLHEKVAPLADREDDKRRAYMDRDQFVGYPRADEILAQLTELVGLENALKPRSYIIVGESQMGKSAILKRLETLHPADDNPEGDFASVPVLRIQYPESRGVAIYREVIRALNGTIASAAGTGVQRSAALNLMSRVQTRVFVVDELANAIGSTPKLAMDSIKFIMNDLNRPIVLGATKEAYALIKHDRQIRNRFDLLTLPRFKDDEQLSAFLGQWEARLPLRMPSNLAAPALQTKIHRISEGLLGNVVRILQLATKEAIGAEEQITAELLDELGWRSQAEDDEEVRRL